MSNLANIKGMIDIANALMEVPAKLEKNILRGAVRAGSKVVAEEAKRRAPVLASPDPRRKPGTLKKAIKVRGPGIVRGVGVVGGVAVRPLTSAQIAKFKRTKGANGASNPDDPFYARFVERGTVKMSAQPFMRPALESKAREATDAVGDYARARLDSELRK